MRALLVVVAVISCGAAPVKHQLWKTYLNLEKSNPTVLRIPRPGINYVDNHDIKHEHVVSKPMADSPVPSPVVVKLFDTPPAEENAPLELLGSAHQKSPIPVPVPVLVRLEPVESHEDITLPVPGKNLVFDEPINTQQDVKSQIVSPMVVTVAAPEPMEAPEPPMPSLGAPFVGGQFHTQDELKQYSFGHWGGPSTRVETKDALERTHGSFAYINPVGDVHMRKYAAGPGMGFKVVASDLVVDTPEVAYLKAVHEQAHLTFLSFRKEIA